jgi:hypothetical protein
MKPHFVWFVLFCWTQTPLLAHDSTSVRRQFLFGVDVLKNVSMNRFQPGRSGYHLEVLCKPYFDLPIHPYLGGGIGKSSNGRLFTNTRLETSGYFLKGGAEFVVVNETRHRVIFGTGLLFSSGQYSARYTFPGDYFPDAIETNERTENRVAFQLYTAFTFPIIGRLEGAVLVNGTMFLEKIPKSSKAEPSWYTPGVGYHRSFPLYPDFVFQLFFNLGKI